MRRITITALILLAACGPTIEQDEIDITKPAPSRPPMADEDEDGSSSGDHEESESSSGGEQGTGGGSGGSEGESSSGVVEPAGCMLPEADTACWAIIEAAEAIGCERVGGSCMAVIAAQYFLGDAGLAERTAACEANCGEVEEACSFVLGPPYPQVSVCYMTTEADCLANAAAAGIAPDDSVAITCARLAASF